MRKDPKNLYEEGLLGQLQQLAAVYRKMYQNNNQTPGNLKYHSVYELLLAYGGFMDVDQNGGAYKRRIGEPRECYRNAGLAAIEETGLLYAEGMALCTTVGLATLHAWNVDPVTMQGVEFTASWVGYGAAYWGVAYQQRYFTRNLFETKTWGVIGGEFMDIELLQNGFEVEALHVSGHYLLPEQSCV